MILVVFHTSYNTAMAENLDAHGMAKYDGSEATTSAHQSRVIRDGAISHQYSTTASQALRFTLPTRWLQKMEHLVIAIHEVSTAARSLNHASIPGLSSDTGVSQPPPAQTKILNLSLILPPHSNAYTHTHNY